MIIHGHVCVFGRHSVQISAFLMPLNRCPLNIPHCRYTEKYPAIHTRNPPHALWRPEGKLGEKLIAIHAVYQARAAPIHRQQWDNPTDALCGSMAHAGPARGGEKLVINLYLELGFRPCLCVRLLFIHVRRCVCESWFDNLHTISPWARVPLKKQYLLSVGSTRRRRGDASGGRRLSITGGRVWVFQQRSTSERSAARAKPRIIK